MRRSQNLSAFIQLRMASILLSFFVGNCHFLLAQDSTIISYTQEIDTLKEQRFIDRYENVFMTKVPTRHMLKLGWGFIPGSSTAFRVFTRQALELSYEFKLSKALSLGILFSENEERRDSSPMFTGIVTARANARWYYDMKRRISEGKSANNFTGNYFALVAVRQDRFAPERYGLIKGGIEFGIQRRYDINQYVDFGAGIFYQKYEQGYFADYKFIKSGDIKEVAISTRTAFGTALGDWKRRGVLPHCEVLHCEELVTHQFRIMWPDVTIGWRSQNATIRIGYEHKLGKSPVSVSTQMLGYYANYVVRGPAGVIARKTTDRSFQYQPSLEMRYYFLQKRKITRGTGGNNLSGIYFGPYSDYIKFHSRTQVENRSKEHLGLGLCIGSQVTLFRNVYLDISAAESWNLLKRKPGNASDVFSFRAGFGLSI